MRRSVLSRGCVPAVLLLVSLFPLRARAGGVNLSPEERKILEDIYSGDPKQAIALARALQHAEPDEPIGYLLEGEALWWDRYCSACEMKWGIVEAWKHDRQHEDEAYLALADKAISLAQMQLDKSETAQMRFLLGMSYALKVRVYGLRGENRNAARAGVAARGQMLRALEIDPQLADATGGLGLYNYYVDTLSPVVKLLRFFMGIPGGDKVKGVEQMQTGMNEGTLLAVDLRFILGRALRQYDRKYEDALSIAQPLVQRYPQNPLFLLLVANLNAELGRDAKAATYVQAVQQLPESTSPCVARAHQIANSLSATLH
jgi:tetratricopeptide (TPR) repeat protein